jgi:hypothetical protein
MDYILSLESIEMNLYRFGGPILMVFGSVSCILSCIVFSKKNLRKNPCSVYFVALNISNFLFIYSSILFPILSIGYDFDATAYNTGVCRYNMYASFLFEWLSSCYLLLVCGLWTVKNI